MIGVIDTEGDCAEWTFPAEPGSVRSARHAVRDALGCWGLDAAVGDMTVLLVSELVTNSLRYASGPIGVRLVRVQPDASGNGSGGLTGDFSTDLRLDSRPVRPAAAPPLSPGLLVEVSDPLPDPPTERSAGPDDEGGRGLQLVACSARRWGTRRGKSGKTVWFELPLPG
ncbi:ATP-binding protein [Streptomyces sp. C11-1]|uniref:ATP-binding protein n=1 Tax=Streptomyces durocortorensis TaxID=2811104 RepID=A0ABY9W2C5_9ACTN|nr:ATP-binding protein [Streptomyces durocortorensis]WNF29362.1 ATP-binding protein [Streptomyces durocortorensis]